MLAWDRVLQHIGRADDWASKDILPLRLVCREFKALVSRHRAPHRFFILSAVQHSVERNRQFATLPHPCQCEQFCTLLRVESSEHLDAPHQVVYKKSRKDLIGFGGYRYTFHSFCLFPSRREILQIENRQSWWECYVLPTAFQKIIHQRFGASPGFVDFWNALLE